MIDLHTHTTFSDGDLIPAELLRRASVLGYQAIAITDHGDHSNLDFVIPRLARVCKEIGQEIGIVALPGIELTHIPPDGIAPLVQKARELGAFIVLMHGDTPVEPVYPGTNRAAILAGVDILAHPGLITEEDVRLAIERDVSLEISGRRGHSFTNGHVARLAKAAGAKLVLGSDTHSPSDLLSPELARAIAIGAGLTQEDWEKIQANAQEIVDRAK